MEVRQLRYFVTVAEHGHFGRATERLHIVQPAVSKQIARFERELGLTLFDRSRRQARLTPDGEAFLPHARRALRGVDRAGAAAADLAAGQAGILRIGTSEALGTRLEDIFGAFRATHPGVSLQLTTIRSTPAKLAAVAAGDLDAPFVSAAPNAPGVAVHHLRDEPLLLAVPPNRAAAADLATLGDLPLARSAREEDPGAYDLITEACTTAGFAPRLGPLLTRAQDILAGPVAAGHCYHEAPCAETPPPSPSSNCSTLAWPHSVPAVKDPTKGRGRHELGRRSPSRHDQEGGAHRRRASAVGRHHGQGRRPTARARAARRAMPTVTSVA